MPTTRAVAPYILTQLYKPDLPLRFITEELGFESDEQSARFILQHAPAELLQERQDGSVCLLTAKAGSVFEEARAAAHRLIDIKGQI
ncbi:hypothetical protein KEM52_001002 [Ascosphaera acerosa]|nr:hypothetical protein KEM52_001002 [Ascosphaera acerosa]